MNPATQAKTETPEATPGVLNVPAADLLGLLSIPADQATVESILNAIKSLAEKAASADVFAASLEEVKGKLGTLEAAEQQRLVEQIDAELADYELDDETAGVLRALPPEQRAPLLTKMPRKAAPAAPDAKPEEKKSAAVPPPKPMHDPAGDALTPQQKADAGSKLIKEVQGEGKFKDYSSAREEARRRKPDLFS